MRNSFFPSTTKMWNDLDISIRNSASLSSFKSNIKSKGKPQNKCFLVWGSRKSNILHCRLRNRASSLNYDLFRANLSNTAECACGNPCEDSYHFLCVCPLYTQHRNLLIRELQPVRDDLTLDLLLYGDPKFSINVNTSIAKSVQNYISKCNRFDWMWSSFSLYHSFFFSDSTCVTIIYFITLSVFSSTLFFIFSICVTILYFVSLSFFSSSLFSISI